MRKLLQLKTNLFQSGQSSQFADAFVATWPISHPGAEVITCEFAVDLVPHLDGDGFRSFLTKPEERSTEQQDGGLEPTMTPVVYVETEESRW